MYSLYLLFRAFQKQLYKLRDNISEINIKVNKKNINSLKLLENNMLKIERNMLIFLYEVKIFSENNKLFHSDITTYYRLKPFKEIDHLYENIRLHLISNSNDLLNTFSSVKQSLNTTSKLVNSISNERVSNSNFISQIIMIIITGLMLIFTEIMVITSPIGFQLLKNLFD